MVLNCVVEGGRGARLDAVALLRKRVRAQNCSSAFRHAHCTGTTNPVPPSRARGSTHKQELYQSRRYGSPEDGAGRRHEGLGRRFASVVRAFTALQPRASPLLSFVLGAQLSAIIARHLLIPNNFHRSLSSFFSSFNSQPLRKNGSRHSRYGSIQSRPRGCNYRGVPIHHIRPHHALETDKLYVSLRALPLSPSTAVRTSE